MTSLSPSIIDFSHGNCIAHMSYSKSTTNVIVARVTLFNEATLKARTFKLDETINLEVGAFKLD